MEEKIISAAIDAYIAIMGREKWDALTAQEQHDAIMILVSDMNTALDNAAVSDKMNTNSDGGIVMTYIEKHRIAYRDCKKPSDFDAYRTEKDLLETAIRNAHSLQDDFIAAGLIEILPKLNDLIDEARAAKAAYEADENKEYDGGMLGMMEQ